LLLALSLLLNAGQTVSAQKEADEYRIKAAFLFHFAQLVDWPPDALGPDNQPFSLCTVGQEVLPGTLESTVDGKQIGSHPIKVRHLQEVDDPRACQVLFIGERDKKHVAAILVPLKAVSVLTVGDIENFAEQGGVIGFCFQENKIRFDINLQAAQRAHLKISSRLLLLAKHVIGESGQG
jgi:YfiR/HmsC-like